MAITANGITISKRSITSIDTNTLYFKYSSNELIELCTSEEISTVVGPKGEDGAPGLAGKDASLINTNGSTPLKLWVGSQEELDLVIPKDSTTIYMVEEAE